MRELENSKLLIAEMTYALLFDSKHVFWIWILSKFGDY
jgi:hypothetical protein